MQVEGIIDTVDRTKCIANIMRQAEIRSSDRQKAKDSVTIGMKSRYAHVNILTIISIEWNSKDTKMLMREVITKGTLTTLP